MVQASTRHPLLGDAQHTEPVAAAPVQVATYYFDIKTVQTVSMPHLGGNGVTIDDSKSGQGELKLYLGGCGGSERPA